MFTIGLEQSWLAVESQKGKKMERRKKHQTSISYRAQDLGLNPLSTLFKPHDSGQSILTLYASVYSSV